MTAAVATYTLGETYSGTTPGRASESLGRLWNILRHESSLGTGSDKIWIRELRVEVVEAPTVLFEADTLAPAYVLRRIRRISGLTWEELSTAFNVSRRTLHNWDAGLDLKQKHLTVLHKIAGLLGRLDTGNSIQMRNLLLNDFQGRNALIMLKRHQFQQAEALLKKVLIPSPEFLELPEAEFRKRIPQGIPLAAFESEETIQPVPGKPIRGIMAPRIKKGLAGL